MCQTAPQFSRDRRRSSEKSVSSPKAKLKSKAQHLKDTGEDHTGEYHFCCGLPICQEDDERDPPHIGATSWLLVPMVQH